MNFPPIGRFAFILQRFISVPNPRGYIVSWITLWGFCRMKTSCSFGGKSQRIEKNGIYLFSIITFSYRWVRVSTYWAYKRGNTDFLVLTQKMKFFIKDYFSKCDQIRSFLWIWSHLLKKSLTESFIFLCSVSSKLLTQDNSSLKLQKLMPDGDKSTYTSLNKPATTLVFAGH